MTSLITEEIRAKATELYHGNDECMTQARRLFKEMNFPNGLLPLRDVEECGYVEETGFVWLKQKQEIEHTFEKIDKHVRYATEVTAYVEPCKILKLTGVQAKELLIWVTINEITVETPESDKVVFKNNFTGLNKIFPKDAFVVEVKEETQVKEKEEVDAVAAEPVEVKEV
ncbi:uncharacterized protein LOC141597344 [Silene latifolia]|uniref:uncharacterized protein LOC141597344 n=1 Tax=Silene latifolia TaxID=37657 RepID=UPI003D77124C